MAHQVTHLAFIGYSQVRVIIASLLDVIVIEKSMTGVLLLFG